MRGSLSWRSRATTDAPAGWDAPEEPDERRTAERVQASRERVLERQRTSRLAQRCPRKFNTAVVGVTFCAEYPQNLHDLATVAAKMLWRVGVEPEPVPAVFVRAPENVHDANAVEVHVPSLGERAHIGHLPRAVAALVAPTIDAGVRWLVAVNGVKIRDEHWDRPGIELICEQVPEST